MTESGDELDDIDQLLEAGDLDGARHAVGNLKRDDTAARVLRIKLGLYDGSVPAGAAMQQLIRIMRTEPKAPRAKELYQEASNRAFESRTSSVSHSHPPPPTDEESES